MGPSRATNSFRKGGVDDRGYLSEISRRLKTSLRPDAFRLSTSIIALDLDFDSLHRFTPKKKRFSNGFSRLFIL